MGLAAMSLNFLLGFTRRPVLRTRGLLRTRRLRRRDGDQISRRCVRSLPWHSACWSRTLAAMVIGALIVKRRGVYFAMVTIAFGQVFYFLAFRWNSLTGGDDGLTGWHRMPIDFGFARLDIFGSDKAFYYFALTVFAVCVAGDGAPARVSLRTHSDRDPRERAARALSWAPDRVPYLAVLRDLVPVRQRRRRALCAAQQLHRSARAALRPVRQSRHHRRCSAGCVRSGGR